MSSMMKSMLEMNEIETAIVKCSCCRDFVKSAIQFPVHGKGVGILCKSCLMKGLDLFSGDESPRIHTDDELTSEASTDSILRHISSQIDRLVEMSR